jgi:Cu/Ag efflux protein CusF
MATTRFVLTCGAFALATSSACAQQMRRGLIENVDEPNGSITIQRTAEGTVGASRAAGSERFAVQDGLLFDALRTGDKVSFSAQDINGVNTITILKRE